MLFGSSKKTYGASNIMPGDPSPVGMPQLPQQVMDPGVQQPSGHRKVNWVGVLADALAGAAGQPGPYAAQMERERQQRLALAQDQRKRSLDFQDFQKQFDYKANHDPTPGTADMQNFNWYKSLPPEDRQVYQQMHPQYRQGPDGQFYPIQVAPAAPAGPLPTFTADDWNKAGGGAGNGAGGFQRRPGR